MGVITANKHEYNLRKFEELNSEIRRKEKELSKSKGFFKTYKLKNEIKKLYDELNNHGEEVLRFEIQSSQ